MSGWLWAGKTDNHPLVLFTPEELRAIVRKMRHSICTGMLCDVCFLSRMADDAESMGRSFVDFHRPV